MKSSEVLSGGVFFLFGAVTTIDHMQRGVRNPTILETPIALVIVIIPIGGAILFLEVLVKIRKTLKK